MCPLEPRNAVRIQVFLTTLEISILVHLAVWTLRFGSMPGSLLECTSRRLQPGPGHGWPHLLEGRRCRKTCRWEVVKLSELSRKAEPGCKRGRGDANLIARNRTRHNRVRRAMYTSLNSPSETATRNYPTRVRRCAPEAGSSE